MKKDKAYFLAGINIIIYKIVDDEIKFLLLKRSGYKGINTGTWECVTGQVEQGEDFPTAAIREIWEEIAIKAIKEDLTFLKTFLIKIEEYELQGIVYSLKVETDNTEIHLSHEHTDYTWKNLQEIVDLLGTGHWLIPPLLLLN